MKNIIGVVAIVLFSISFFFLNSCKEDSEIISGEKSNKTNDSLPQKTEKVKRKGGLHSSKKGIKNKRPTIVSAYENMDQYAFNTPASNSNSIESLAKYFSAKASNDYEKARLIYSWIAKNINYDDDGYNTGNYNDCTANTVFKTKRAVCEGYSNLYASIAEKCGLEVKVISGYAKGYSYKIGQKFLKTNHAWNSVKIDGDWKLLDVTWGEGYGKNVDGKLKSVKKYTDYWFCTDPHEFIFKHLPQKPADQLIDQPISKLEYELLPEVDEDIFCLGVSAKDILSKMLTDKKFRIPNAYQPEYDLKIKKIELEKFLGIGNEYYFEFVSKEDLDIAFINGKDWTYFKNEDGIYKGTIKAVRGKLSINVKLKGFDNSYYTLLEYVVR